jgi:TetR/AcrR family transcriptional regulator
MRGPRVVLETGEKRLPRGTESTKPRRRAIGRPARKKSVGKETIVLRTIELLRVLPPEKLSLTLAARNAGVHLTLIKYYFADRTRLLVDVARHLTLELAERVRASENDRSPPLERLRIRIDAMVDFYFLNPFYHRLMLEIIADEKHELAAELISVWISKTLEIYDGIITAGIGEGILRAVDPRFTYLAIMGLCEQFHLGVRLFERAKTGPRESTEQSAAKYKKFLYDLVFYGITTQPRKKTRAQSALVERVADVGEGALASRTPKIDF